MKIKTKIDNLSITSIENKRKFVDICSKFNGNIKVHKTNTDTMVDAKSMLGILSIDMKNDFELIIESELYKYTEDLLFQFVQSNIFSN